MAKIVTLPVDLGIDIEELIQSDVLNLTSGTQEMLDKSIATAKTEQELAQKLKSAKDSKVQAVSDKLAEIIAMLVAAGTNGLPRSRVLAMAEPLIPANGLAARLKSELKASGSEYRLVIQKDVYSLVLFGKDENAVA